LQGSNLRVGQAVKTGCAIGTSQREARECRGRGIEYPGATLPVADQRIVGAIEPIAALECGPIKQFSMLWPKMRVSETPGLRFR